jgi:GTP-binding protein EngB required for normal cell division
MSKKKIKINLGDKGKIEKELDTSLSLVEVRKELLDIVSFPFVFGDEDEKEIAKEDEQNRKLEDILDGKNLYLIKEKINRKMLGYKAETKNGLDIYVYPEIKLSNEAKDCSSNIMVIGETGVGKSTWIHCFINFMQGIQIEENNRYYLFDEKKLQEQYEQKYGKKPDGCSVTDTPAIYNIEPSILFNNPIRLIDTAGFGDTRGPQYDEKITKDIQELFESSEIENLNAICLIFKASETRAHDRAKAVLNKLFSLFGKDIKNNIIIIFTFVDDFNQIKALKTLKDKSSPFEKILGDIDKLPHFGFNNLAYFTSDKESFNKAYENNTKNFAQLLKYIFSLKRISLESTREVINSRMHIKNNISNLCGQLNDIMLEINSATFNQMKLLKLQSEYEKNAESKIPLIPYTVNESYTEIVDTEEKCESGWYVLYCNEHNKVCHKKCKGSKEGWHSSEYGCNVISTFGHECTDCGCLDEKHRFKDSYIIKKEVEKTRSVVKHKQDPNAIQSEEEKKKNREELNKLIEQKNREISEKNVQIHNSLRRGIDCLFQLALKNNVLNELALKRDDKKYGFTKEILKENMNKAKAKSEIFEIFNETLDNIEQLCQSEQLKEKTVQTLQEKLKQSN